MVTRILTFVALTLVSTALSADEQQRCSAPARECELQIRQMLAGKTYLGVKLTQSRLGLEVKSVTSEGPAAAGGLKEGDRIFAVNGKVCSKADVAEFKRMIGQMKSSKALHLTVVRAGDVRRLYVRPEKLSKTQVDKVVASHIREAHQKPAGDGQASASH